MGTTGKQSTTDEMGLLRLMQLADSALPIGATAHSFGLETLTTAATLTPHNLELFLEDYVQEVGRVDAAFCRDGHHLGDKPVSLTESWQSHWFDLNDRCGAWKPARESRTASATLGRRLLQFVVGLEDDPLLQAALESSLTQRVAVYHAPVFGLVGGLLGQGPEVTVAAFLQQTVSGLLSACQKLMPLGQNHAAAILWRMKPVLLAAAQASADQNEPSRAAFAASPLVDLGGMRHAYLPVRLFIS